MTDAELNDELEQLREQFESGDSEALRQAITLCFGFGIIAPEWIADGWLAPLFRELNDRSEMPQDIRSAAVFAIVERLRAQGHKTTNLAVYDVAAAEMRAKFGLKRYAKDQAHADCVKHCKSLRS